MRLTVAVGNGATRMRRVLLAALLVASVGTLASGCSDAAPGKNGSDTVAAERATGAPEAQQAPLGPPASVADRVSCLVTDSSIGPITLGMTLEQARGALPSAVFQRRSDGEGVALVDVVVGADTLMTVFADEVIATAPIAWGASIGSMETFSARCGTAGGVRPGASIAEVESVLGPMEAILRTEIEWREYIGFTNQPDGLIFRLNYTGVFPEGSRDATRYRPDARILSIVVAGQ